MYFINETHKNFYEQKLVQAKQKDSYTKSLIYLLSSNKETRKNFEKIYDIEKNEIEIDSLKEPWQTSSSTNTCRLAFNLFGEISSDEIEENSSYQYTVSSIFSKLDINMCAQACKIRFNCI